MLFKIFYEITSIPMVIVVLLAVSLFHGVGGGQKKCTCVWFTSSKLFLSVWKCQKDRWKVHMPKFTDNDHINSLFYEKYYLFSDLFSVLAWLLGFSTGALPIWMVFSRFGRQFCERTWNNGINSKLRSVYGIEDASSKQDIEWSVPLENTN